MRRHRVRVQATLLIPLLASAVVAAASVPALAGRAPHAAAGTADCTSLSGSGGETLPEGGEIGDADNPVGVPFETLSHDASGAIRIDGVPVPKTNIGGNLNYAIISRADRKQVVDSGSINRGAPGAVRTLLDLAKRYADDEPAACLMVVSGEEGFFPGGLADFKDLAKALGVSKDDVTSDDADALTEQSAPFSLLGIPGAEGSGSGWLNVGLVPDAMRSTLKGDIVGQLQWNINTARYDYVDEQFPQFNTSEVRHGVHVISFDGADYYPDGELTVNTSGFHVLVVDSVNLHVLANQTLPTNSTTQSSAALQETFARQLTDDVHMAGFEQSYANKPAPLIVLQSYGNPFGVSEAWQHAGDAIAKLGGNWLGFLAAKQDDPSGSLSLVGRAGGQSYTAFTSSYTGNAGALAGVLARTRTMEFEPQAVGDPAHGLNSQMVALAYQTPRPFRPFTGGEAKAAAYLGVKVDLCKVEAGCDVRQYYWAKYRVNWSDEATLAAATHYQSGAGFTEGEFKSVQDTLIHEFTGVSRVESYFDKLAAVFGKAASDARVSVDEVGKRVLEEVQPPSSEASANLLELIERIVGVGELVVPEQVAAVAGALSAVTALVTFLVGQDGDSTLPDKIRAKSDELAAIVTRDLQEASLNFGMIGRLIASDQGKLSRFLSLYLTPKWDLGASAEPAKNAITRAATQWFATELVPVAYPYLAIAVGATPNNLECRAVYRIAPVRPWADQPELAQFRTVVGLPGGQPNVQSVFFGVKPDTAHYFYGRSPTDKLAKFLFGPVRDPLLNIHSFLSDANFDTTNRVFNDPNRYCP